MSRLGKQCNALLLKYKYIRKETYHDQLMKLTWNHLLGVAGMFLHNKDDIEDALQNSFLRVHNYINSYRDGQDGFNWLIKIVQVEAYKLNKIPFPTVPLETAYMTPTEEDFTERIEAETVISKYLQKYSEQDQILIHMHFFEGFSIRELAREKKMSKSKINKRIREILKEILEK